MGVSGGDGLSTVGLTFFPKETFRVGLEAGGLNDDPSKSYAVGGSYNGSNVIFELGARNYPNAKMDRGYVGMGVHSQSVEAVVNYSKTFDTTPSTDATAFGLGYTSGTFTIAALYSDPNVSLLLDVGF